MKKKAIEKAFRQSLAIFPGYMVLGTGFGVLMCSKGFNLFHCLAMSVFIYAGSMQYAGVDLLSLPAGIISTAMMTIMVNIRHLFYGVAMISRYQKLQHHKLYDIFALTDETFSIACNADTEGIDEDSYYFYLSLFNHLYWISGTLIGAILGDILPIDFSGIDFSMTALFIVIVLNQWENHENHLIVIMSFIISVICIVIFGSKDFLIPAMIGIVIMLMVMRKKEGYKDV